ncbi:MAG TPA: hypothetical protein VFM18_21065, partial [Methanosarcina sp.]|nr:hypothetical protein [Methanosarcina sp.]
MVSGQYRFYQSGELIAAVNNTVTDNGKRFLLRYLAGLSPALINCLAVGAGGTAPTASDVEMNFEFERAPVTLRSVDYTSSDVIFKATMPAGPTGYIYEIGSFPSVTNASSGRYQSATLFSFNGQENWTNSSTRDTTNSRVGGSAISDTISSASATITHSNTYTPLDLAGYNITDRFVFAFITYSNYVQSVSLSFKNTAGDFMTGVFTPNTHTAGTGLPQYQIISINKSSFTNLDKDWSNIVQTNVTVTSKSSASGVNQAIISLDGVKVLDADQNNPNYSLVSRA